MGTTIRLIKGDTRSLDYSSYVFPYARTKKLNSDVVTMVASTVTLGACQAS